METIYLVDFENVNSKEALKLATLDANDTVYFFYTDNCPKVPLDFFLGNKAILMFKKTPKGDQVLDKHLIGTLGYLVAKNGKEKKYAVISNDQGYRSCIDMWNSEEGVDISLKKFIGTEEPKSEPKIIAANPKPVESEHRIPSKIQPTAKRAKDEDVPVTPMVPQEPRKIVAKGAPMPTVPSNTELSSQIIKEMNDVVGYMNSGKIASIVIKCRNQNKNSRDVYRAMIGEFGKKRGGQIYHSLKDKTLLDSFFPVIA